MSKPESPGRREFIGKSVAIAGAAVVPFAVASAEQTPATVQIQGERFVPGLNGQMRARAIPGTDEFLPVIGLGSPQPFIKLPDAGKQLPISLIQTMMNSGGRVIDAPPFFRPDDPILGDILTEMDAQKDLFLTGKITVSGKQEGIAHLERVSRYLNKSPMDCLMVHNMRDIETHWATLKQWKQEGKVRYIGVSRTRATDFAPLEAFMRAEKPDFLLIGYSITQQGPADRILPLAADLGTAVIGAEAFKASDDGAFFKVVAGKPLPDWAAEFDCESWAQFSLKYILSNPAITTIVTETNKVKHVIDNMRAGYGRLPEPSMRQRMSDYLLGLGA
jgi:diketogulonate reductase-like aldo/keto reductase